MSTGRQARRTRTVLHPGPHRPLGRADGNLKPNRTVPFKLPPDIEAKVARLFALVKLNTGSVDFIVDQQGRFIFLEINPVGQFSMVSVPCNYFLEKMVATTLMNYARRQKDNSATGGFEQANSA